MTADELLEQMEGHPELYEDVIREERVCTIDPITRKIHIPPELEIFGVESDENTNSLKFQCPKFVGNGIDLTKYQLRVNYQNAAGAEEGKDQYIVEDVAADGDFITFSWKLSRKVLKYKGYVKFIICAVTVNGDVIETEWNTTLGTGTVLEGLEVTNPEPTEAECDIIAQLLDLVTRKTNESMRDIIKAKESSIETIENLKTSSLKAVEDKKEEALLALEIGLYRDAEGYLCEKEENE